MKGKKTACMLLVAVLAIAMVLVSVDADPQLPKIFVDPPTYTATLPGEVFTIDINIANVDNLAGFEFKLGYNTTLLDALDAVIGPFPRPPISPLIEIHDPEGYLFVQAGFPVTSGNGTLSTITFKATYAGSASCTLHLYDTALAGAGAEPIDHDVEGGNYKFGILSVTVETDKPAYLPGENVEIHGNLTVDGSPLQGLVALEVDDPANRRMVVRTLQIGPTPQPGNITIFKVYPCDRWGVPKESFTRGGFVYFNVTVINSGTATKNVTITVNAYDNDTVPFGVTSIIGRIPGLSSSYAIISVLSQEWVSLGNATVYTNAFTDYPKQGGTPYCPEKSAKFQITGGTLGAAAPEAQGSGSNPTDGNYSLTFKLSTEATTGIYRVYATTFYKISIKSSTVFGVNVICVPDHYPTIQEAVDAATPTNNSILVFPETYNEHVTINKNVTLVGVDPTTTIINGSGTGTVITVTADKVEISRFTIQNGGKSFPDSGIALSNSSDSTISGNIILENYCGIYLDFSSQQNIIRDNTITSNNGYGINIHSSDNNDITGNSLSNNNYGIHLNYSANSKLRNNMMTCNKYNFGVFGDYASDLDFTHDIDYSNTVDGKPIVYWINQQNRSIPPNAGFVAVVSSTEIAVRGLDLTKNGQGVLLAFTTDSLIERVNIVGNEYGIYLVTSQGNTIIGSSVSNNTVGIYQRYCSENIICRNNFINNTIQVDLYQSSNTWDDGAGKGNYWSDYEGEDLDSPPDGVGDTLLPHQGVDWYPLMNPYILVHDIAIISVTSLIPYNASHVYPGWIININVTVKNEGDYTESFLNVAAQYDGNTIETKTITITPQKETLITFTWDTTGVSPGTAGLNYTIKAVATVVPGETETTDNTFIDGMVQVNLLGDVDSNGMVNVLDILLVKLVLGSQPGEPRWNPHADINCDGVITVLDMLLVKLNIR